MNNTSITFANTQYFPLPGKSGGVLEAQRLFLAPDHLLVTTRSINRETYKRFYLADIQAISIQKTSDGATMNIFFAVIAGLFGVFVLAGIVYAWLPLVQVVLTVIAASFLGFVLLNAAFGPTCRCHILSAVHEEPLRCLGRLNTAQRVVTYLKAVVEGVQGAVGDLTADDTNLAQRVDREAQRRLVDAEQRVEDGKWHIALFGFLIISAITGALGLYFRQAIPAVVYMIPSFVAMLLALVAVIRQRDTDVPNGVRNVTWVALVGNCVSAGLYLYAATFGQVAVQPLYPQDMDQVISSIGFGFSFIANAVSAVVNFVVGPLGLYAMSVWRRAAAVLAEQQRISDQEGAQQ